MYKRQVVTCALAAADAGAADAGAAAAAAPVHSSDSRHSAASDDAAVSDWLHIASARALIAQLGLRCLGALSADCHHGDIAGDWDSAFSKSAQIRNGRAIRARLLLSGLRDFRRMPAATL